MIVPTPLDELAVTGTSCASGLQPEFLGRWLTGTAKWPARSDFGVSLPTSHFRYGGRVAGWPWGNRGGRHLSSLLPVRGISPPQFLGVVAAPPGFCVARILPKSFPVTPARCMPDPETRWPGAGRVAR